MKQMKSVLLFLSLCICININAEVYTGNCGANGDNVKWTLDTETGLLEIYGSGDMENCFTHPWTNYSTSVKSCTIDDGVTSIGNYAFYYCSSLTSITIPNSVTSIGSYAFCMCSSLASVTIPNSVTSIGEEAFRSCSRLTSITIPNSVTSIGDHAFSGCYFTIDNFINNSSLDAKSNNYWGATICDERTDDGLCITAGVVVTYVGNGTSVAIPNSVTSIGDYAFYYCSSLTSITIPNSVTSIGNHAFCNCI